MKPLGSAALSLSRSVPRWLAASVLTLTLAGAALVLTPGVSSAVGVGGGVTLAGSCTSNGYPKEIYITEMFTGLSTTNSPGYEAKFTYTGTDNQPHTFTDGGPWETDPDHSGSYQSNFFGPALQGGTGINWELDSIDSGGFSYITGGLVAVSGNVCTPENPPRAPEFGDTSDKASNAGVVTIPIEVSPKSSGSIEILNSANGVIASGGYDDVLSTGAPSDTDAVNVKIQLTKAQLDHLWYVQFWTLPMKITSTNSFGTTITNDNHELVEPANLDKPTFTKAQKTIKVSKAGKYTVAFSADPSAECTITVNLGSKKLNHSDDNDADVNGAVSASYTLKTSALHKLKASGKEKVTLQLTAAKGPYGAASSSQVVTLKAPKS